MYRCIYVYMQRININLPDELYDNLKVKAAKEHTTMTALILEKLEFPLIGILSRNNSSLGMTQKASIVSVQLLCKHGNKKGLCKYEDCNKAK